MAETISVLRGILSAVAYAVIFFFLFYNLAKNRNRDRPWLWGLIGALLFPVAVVGVFLWLISVLKGKSIMEGFACLCPRCRQEVPRPFRQNGICPGCGASFRGI